MSASKQFGRYQIVKHLATGGMAEVFLATATGIEGFSRHVVLKQIDPLHSQSPTFVKMFLDEARLAASLHHHNIIQVHDIGREGDTYFFAMEYVHGEDLRSVLTTTNARKEKTPLEHVITIVTAAASALHYAHDHCGPDRKPLNLVHRDVSPSNVLIGFDGNVKVVDFGIAKSAMGTNETRVGDIKGKFSHMSPEQCLGKSLDRRSDVFALGIVLYELLAVRRLFRGDSDFAKMKATIEGTIYPPSKHRPGLPPELDAIVMKALARDPAERYQTADELRVALERFAIMNNLRSSTTALGDYMKQLFGERPEPWLVDDAPPTATVEAGGKSLRHKAITTGYADIAIVAESSPPRQDPSVSKTPMAWAPVQEQPVIVTRKRRLPLLATALAVPLAMMGLLVARSSSDSDSTGTQVTVMTYPGVVAPRATPTANPGTAPTANAGSHGAEGTQLGSEAPALVVASAAPAATAADAPKATALPPTPDTTAIVTTEPTLLPATTAEPIPAKQLTVRPAKHVSRSKRHAKQTAWDPDALTPE
jgi:serine/threonine protein kinase